MFGAGDPLCIPGEMSNDLTLVLSHGCVVTRQEACTDLKTCKVQPTWFRQGQVILIYNLNSGILPRVAPLHQIPSFHSGGGSDVWKRRRRRRRWKKLTLPEFDSPSPPNNPGDIISGRKHCVDPPNWLRVASQVLSLI